MQRNVFARDLAIAFEVGAANVISDNASDAVLSGHLPSVLMVCGQIIVKLLFVLDDLGLVCHLGQSDS